MKSKIVLTLFFASLFCGSVVAQKEITKKKARPMENITPEKVNGLLRKFILDSYAITEKIFTMRSMKVLTGVIPFYLLARQANATVHRQFYDSATHKNINQPPKWLKTMLTDEAMAIPFLGYGLVGLWHTDPEKRRAAQLFSTGLLLAWSTKIIIKEVVKTESTLRPWNENFDAHERSHGGSPSGHTAMAVFMATYLALYKGPKYGIPLSIYAGFVGSMSVAVNHHYVSQIVAGAGLGALIGVAAYSVLEDFSLPENVDMGLATDSRGNLGVRFTYSF